MATDPHSATDSPAGLLGAVRADRRAADAAEARIVVAATTWVHTPPATRVCGPTRRHGHAARGVDKEESGPDDCQW